ncbi:uncharacterized protein LOC110854937 isoform X2 [Folsomia candida]|uniref:uncharacterized protein LOC110854937 isoform X2 n=1 Tax=Folsomia candida TaxID=158441 RepID=UPI000B903489|nr:uncharacterized protein LOC110854937 isoform X2 [Folsomia candida]
MSPSPAHGSTVRGNMSIPEIVERLHRVQLMNEELVEKTGIAELQWCETNKELTQRNNEIGLLKNDLGEKDDQISRLMEDIDSQNKNHEQSIAHLKRENATLQEKLDKIKKLRKEDKVRIKQLEDDVATLRLEKEKLRSEKEKAEMKAAEYRREIDRLQATLDQHYAEICKIRANMRAQVIEKLQRLMRPALYQPLVEFLESSQTINSPLRVEFEANIDTGKAGTPTQKANLLIGSHPEMMQLSTAEQTLERDVLPALKDMMGVGKYDKFVKEWNDLALTEDHVNLQRNFFICLSSGRKPTDAAADFLEMYPILYFPLPAFHTDILQVIMNKLSPDDWKIVKAAVWNSGPREANDIMLRRLFHEIVYQFRDRRWPIRAGKTFVYRSGFKFLNWVDYLYPFKRIFWT